MAAGRVSWSGLQVEASRLWWSASRPADGGRQVVQYVWLDDMELGGMDSGGMDSGGRIEAGATLLPPYDASPPGVAVRSRVHEYGGAAFVAMEDGTLVYTDGATQGLWSVRPGLSCRRLTPEPPDDEEHRYADARPVPGSPWMVAVRQRHHAAGVANELVAVSRVAGRHGQPGAVVVVSDAHDFVAAPRPSGGGRRLAFVVWDHPSMPWDDSRLMVGTWRGDGLGPRLTEVDDVAGGAGVSVGQPAWAPDGSLWHMADDGGWWQPYRWDPLSGTRRRMCAAEVEFHAPDWALGQQSYGFLADGRLVCRFRSQGRDRIGIVDPEAGSLVEVELPLVTVTALAAGKGATAGLVALLGASATEPTGVHLLRVPPAPAGAPGASSPQAPRHGRPAVAAVAAVAVAESFTFSSPGGGLAYALVYEPVWASGQRPPLVVICHGGPTGAAEPGFDLAVQQFTSRGVAVAAVDYRGSSGYGRAYRQALEGAWGVADAEDTAACGRALADAGRVDARRMAVRGSSAGGLTALRSATRGGPFVAAVSAYGVTDLRALARDTHKFESRYLDTLVGPWPAAAERYAERSPALHPETIGCAVLLLHGADDEVVPVEQATRLAGALRRLGRRCDLHVFPGEGHGFRRSETLASAAAAELGFLGDLLGFPGVVAQPATGSAGRGWQGRSPVPPSMG